ncbi:hypothetical protein E2C01_072758 [Portunus trituberculatus]|uniref:Uncharacterized protein n=1 Tax=Portunus trituberculatus TaxID=210409 RepID=A0A5B7I7I2_PORTR|nr:hypothetical protein [Portunus trituberculatus]
MDLTLILQWMEECRHEDKDRRHWKMQNTVAMMMNMRQEEERCQEDLERKAKREERRSAEEADHLSPQCTPVTVSMHCSTIHNTHHEPLLLTKPTHASTSTQSDRQPIIYITTWCFL